jgi:hypothetical protein
MTKPGKLKRAAVILAHAAVGWGYCGAIIAMGRQFLSIHTTLVVHAIGAPIGFALISLFYYQRWAFTSPLQTAAAFLGVVVALDLFLSGAGIREELRNVLQRAGNLGTFRSHICRNLLHGPIHFVQVTGADSEPIG